MSATELAWFKSSYSGSSGDDCVEVAVTEQAVYVRDSKDVTRQAFAVGREGWGQFVRFASER
ncbi:MULTISPECIES: DUF397 domain-containing protein [Streptomyces]|uniref:DUF397 domain-containing protein n=1 Tax=Streptomyces TaxID=1883 RepID=UPI001587A660|nr:DUF397 domain-containing protein [Streptomyces sp. KAI 90]MBZ2409146.1 DUF397 domain-containing protein [Streptomyces sp. L06]NUV93912.1 DUF397 domain-containing protein [Streptomyces sp. KAI 90]